MPAIVTDQFRILNASNFVAGVSSSTNSYFVSLGLPNPQPASVGFGRANNWNTATPNPVDSFSEVDHIGDTTQFGKRVTDTNVRRLVRRINWTKGVKYDMYRQDYSTSNTAPNSNATRLYDANYYVINSNFNVYVCIENGSSGINTTGNASEDEPAFTDLEPSKAGNSGDGYVWKYLFTVSPSDIIKFDSTEYITVPNGWATSTDSQIRNIRENGDSSVNNNQIKHVYIENAGGKYADGLGQEVKILGDGVDGKARVDIVSGVIKDVTVSSGGKDYSYALIDLGALQDTQHPSNQRAKLVPIIPPSLGHGYDIYTELGTDKVLIYARFDDSTKDFPTDTKFAQVGIVKNPTQIGTANTFTGTTFSSLSAFKFKNVTGTPTIGEEITQDVTDSNGDVQKASAYVASYDKETQVMKYFRDRSLNYTTTNDQTDYAGISTSGQIYSFESTANAIKGVSSTFSGTIDSEFSGISTNPSGTKLINLETTFNKGLSQPEINKGSGEIVYLDNRPSIARNTRQKEDVKIILEF